MPRAATAPVDELDDVIIMGADDEDFKDYMPPQKKKKKTPVVALRNKLGMTKSDLPEGVPQPEALPSAAAILDEQASRMALTTKDTSTKKAPKKRWLLGKGGAKRKKLEENNRLETWLVNNGVWVSEKADWGRQSHGVSMAVETREQAENEISGRGLVARRDVNLYEEIARVPLKMLLTKDSSRAKFGANIISDDMSEYSAIALQLIHERFVEEDSFWTPYLDVLPSVQDVGASFAWEEDEIKTLLVGSPLQNMSLFLRTRVREDFQELEDDVLSKHRDTFPANAFTLQNYIWAYCNLFSRAVRLDFEDTPGDFVALVPYIDLINHSPTSQTYIQGILEGVELPFGLVEKERYIIVRADRYYAKYEQIYISYGPKSNAQLLLLYGFCLERNSQDFVQVSISHLLDENDYADAKRRYIAKNKMQTANFPLYRERFTEDMMKFLRLLVVDKDFLQLEDTATPEEVDAAFAQLELRKPLGEIQEFRALSVLKDICQELLSGYETSVEQDEPIIEDRVMFEMLPKTNRMAFRVKYHEKLILRTTLNTLERLINNLGRLTEMEQEMIRKRKANANTFWGKLGVEWEPAIKPVSNLEELMKEFDF